MRDTVERHGIRNIEMLKRVVKFVFDNIGNTFSAKKVADYFKSQQRRVDLNTVYNYLDVLESAFIIRKVSRYDVQGKSILKTNEKYYIRDHYPKYVVTMDSFFQDAVEGIRHISLADFLLNENQLQTRL